MEGPVFLQLTENRELCSETKIIYKGVLKGTSQEVFVKKGLAESEIQKIRHNYSVLNHIKEEAIAPAYFLYGENQDTILMPYYKDISVEYQINKSSNSSTVQNLQNNDKFIISYGIAIALKNAHAQNILHLNLKPSNILLNGTKPKISDFSYKQTFSREELLSIPISTLLYMAPEVRLRNEVSPKADVYSFGLILHFMYTGKKPFAQFQNINNLRGDLLNSPDLQVSIDFNDYQGNERIGEIVSNCILSNPNDRPTFNDIISTLNEIQEDLLIPNFDKYKRRCKAEILKLPSHFQQLRIIADLPETEDQVSSFNFEIENLLEIISNNSNQYICIVFLCGPYQKGKSTLARAITGNQAFMSGNGTKGTTKKILMDPKAYSISDLKNRMNRSLIQLFDIIVEQNAHNEPVFFFVDSVGGGDQDYGKFLKPIIDKANSILASISTICITINLPANNDEETADYLKMIRKGQMLSYSLSISDVILGMRNCPEEVNRRIDARTHDAYELGVRELLQDWLAPHSDIYSQYAKNSLYVMPLADPNDIPNSYTFSVCEIILRIVRTTIRKINALPSKFEGCNFTLIGMAAARLTNYFFRDEEFEKLSIKLHEKLKPVDKNDKNQPVTICNYISVLCQKMINDKIHIGEVENPNVEQIQEEVKNMANEVNTILSLFLPAFLADTNFPFNEFFQIMSDLYEQSKILMTIALPKWIDGATFPKIPQLCKIEKPKVDSMDVFVDGVDAGIDIGTTVTGVAAGAGALGCVLGFFLLFTPFAPVGASLIAGSAIAIAASPAIGGVSGTISGAAVMAADGIAQQSTIDKKHEENVKANEENHKQLIKKEKQLKQNVDGTIDKLIFYYPLIWYKYYTDDAVTWKEFHMDEIKNKKRTFVLFIEKNEDISMIVSAFTGKNPETTGVSATISKELLFKRFSHIEDMDKKVTNLDFTVIYSNSSMSVLILDELKKQNVSDSKIIIIYPIKQNEQLPHFSQSFKCQLHILLFSHDDSHEPYTRKRIETKTEELSSNCQIQKFKTTLHPVIADSFNLMTEGPRCNTTLKEAFNSILFKQ